MAKWIKFSINFATLEEDDADELLNRITDACVEIIDPVCFALGDQDPPPDHRCMRDWTAGATSMTDIADEDLSDEEFEEIFEAAEGASCSFCGRPYPDPKHTIPRLNITVE